MQVRVRTICYLAQMAVVIQCLSGCLSVQINVTPGGGQQKQFIPPTCPPLFLLLMTIMNDLWSSVMCVSAYVCDNKEIWQSESPSDRHVRSGLGQQTHSPFIVLGKEIEIYLCRNQGLRGHSQPQGLQSFQVFFNVPVSLSFWCCCHLGFLHQSSRLSSGLWPGIYLQFEQTVMYTVGCVANVSCLRTTQAVRVIPEVSTWGQNAHPESKMQPYTGRRHRGSYYFVFDVVTEDKTTVRP